MPLLADGSTASDITGSYGQIRPYNPDEMLREAKQSVKQGWNGGETFQLSSMEPADRESFAAGILTRLLRAETADDRNAIAEMYGVVPDADLTELCGRNPVPVLTVAEIVWTCDTTLEPEVSPTDQSAANLLYTYKATLEFIRMVEVSREALGVDQHTPLSPSQVLTELILQEAIRMLYSQGFRDGITESGEEENPADDGSTIQDMLQWYRQALGYEAAGDRAQDEAAKHSAYSEAIMLFSCIDRTLYAFPNGHMYYDRGRCLHKMGNHASAFNEFGRAVQRNPDCVDYQLALALSFYGLEGEHSQEV